DAEGNRYALLVMDSFSHFCEILPLKTIEAREVAERLYHDCITRYGVPALIASDRGVQFLSRIMERLCELTGIKRVPSIPYRPQANSACENMNRQIYKSLKK